MSNCTVGGSRERDEKKRPIYVLQKGEGRDGGGPQLDRTFVEEGFFLFFSPRNGVLLWSRLSLRVLQFLTKLLS